MRGNHASRARGGECRPREGVRRDRGDRRSPPPDTRPHRAPQVSPTPGPVVTAMADLGQGELQQLVSLGAVGLAQDSDRGRRLRPVPCGLERRGRDHRAGRPGGERRPWWGAYLWVDGQAVPGPPAAPTSVALRGEWSRRGSRWPWRRREHRARRVSWRRWSRCARSSPGRGCGIRCPASGGRRRSVPPRCR